MPSSKCATSARSSAFARCSTTAPQKGDPTPTMTNSRLMPSRLSAFDGVLAELVEELAERLRTDPAADVESFLKEHADFAERLRPLLPAVALMAELGRSEVAGVGASTAAIATDGMPTANEAGH